MVTTASDTIVYSRSERTLPVHDLLAQLIAVSPTESGQPGETLHLRHRHEFERGYTAAVLHILERLNVVAADRELLTVSVTSPDGRYCLEQLQDLLGGSASHRQTSEDGYALSPRLTDTLATLEQLRLRRNPTARPIRVQRAVLGLILNADRRGHRKLLLVRDEETGELQLPGGRVEVTDSTLEMALRRELSEELGCGQLLTPEHVELTRVAPTFALERLSPTKGVLTRTVFDAFAARLTQGLPDLREGLCWLDVGELAEGRAEHWLEASSPLLAVLREHRVDLQNLPLTEAR